MVKYLRTLLLLVLLCLGHYAQAQRIQVDIPSVTEAGEPFQVSYSYSGKGALESVVEPKHSGLRLVYGPAFDQSSSVSIINGKRTSSSSVSITYTFLAEKTGTYVIAPTQAMLDGKPVAVPGGRVQVTAGTAQSQRRGEASASRASSAPPVFHYITLPGARRVYEQQALPVRFRLYASDNFELAGLEAPQLDGFVSEEVPDGGKKQLFLDKYQGKDYRAVDLKNLVLFPQRSGTLTIAPAKVTVRVSDPRGADDEGIDALFSFTPSLEQTFATPPTNITVLPLPTAGRPTDFSGAVGSFSLQAQLLTKEPRTNESLTLRLTLQGAGNLKTAISPQVTFPETFEVYDPKETYESTVTATSVQGKKVIDYFAIPQHTGQVTLPPITFSYFDPQQERYVTLRSEAFSFDVKLGKKRSTDERRSMRSAETQMKTLQSDTGRSYPAGWSTATSWSYRLLFPGMILLALGGYLYIRRQQHLRADTLSYLASKANKVAFRRLRTARKHLEAQDREPFYEELLRALWGYLGDKLRLPTSELSRSSVSTLIAERGVAPELITELTSAVEEVEFARYAPAQAGDLQQHYDRVAELIARIDAYSL